jgi:hypothetical protein
LVSCGAQFHFLRDVQLWEPHVIDLMWLIAWQLAALTLALAWIGLKTWWLSGERRVAPTFVVDWNDLEKRLVAAHNGVM